MQSSVDNFGRVVIPKIIREHLGLKPGTLLEIEEQDHLVLLKPAEQQPLLKNKGGVTIFTGDATGDIENTIKEHRQARIKNLRGL